MNIHHSTSTTDLNDITDVYRELNLALRLEGIPNFKLDPRYFLCNSKTAGLNITGSTNVKIIVREKVV